MGEIKSREALRCSLKKIIGMAGVAAVVIFLTSPPISAGEIRRDTRKIRPI
jgi:hypothetical protein